MIRTAGLAVLLSAALVSAGEASIITFTTRAAWQAAVGGGPTTIGFEGIAPVGGTANVADLVLAGIRFGQASVTDPAVGSYISAWGTGAMLFNYGLVAPATISFSTPMMAFGFDYGATACIVVAPCTTANVRMTVSTGEAVMFTGPMPPLQFIGVVSTVPLTGVTVQMLPSFPVLDNFSFAATVPPAVPEPGAAGLLAVALLGSVIRRRQPER